jgi:arabinogalactan endo-1,4-beta-galactosidase
MKHTLPLLAATFAATALLLSSCEVPTYPSSEADANVATKTFTSYDSVTVKSIDATVSSDFMRGMDCSTIYAIEQAGAKFYDEDNTEKDPLAIMKEHGVNWVRLRIWNNPYAETSLPAGACDLAKTKAIAVRAKALGMKVLLDFHYSDTWADPDSQKMPAAWTSLTTVAAVTDAIYDYTYDTLVSLNEAGCLPDMVQLGNEIDTGIFTSGCATTDVQGDVSAHAANFAAYLNAAATATRLAAPKAKIMIHVSRGGNAAVSTSFFNRIATHSGAAATVAEVDFDVIGLSYYPYLSSHGTLSELKSNMASVKSVYAKDVCIAETSYGWSSSKYGDTTSNDFWTDDEQQAYTQLVTTGSGGNESDFVITETTVSGTTANAIEGTPQNQANVVRAIMQVTAEDGGLGVFYWGGDWICADGIKDNWENQALFDIDGKCLPSMNVFSVTGTSE